MASCNEESPADPPTLDYAADLNSDADVNTYLKQSILLAFAIPPIGVIALFCALMSHWNLTGTRFSAAYRWGQRSAHVGLFGILLLVFALPIVFFVIYLVFFGMAVLS